MSRIRVTSQIEEAQRNHAESIEKMEEADAKLQALPDDATEEERKFHSDYFERCKRDEKRWAETHERLVAIAEARQTIPPAADDDDDPDVQTRQARNGSPRVSVKGEPLTYRKGGTNSFFGDLYNAKVNQDEGAQKRLHQHAHEMRVEQRDVTTADPGAGGIIPPVYLAEQHIDLPRPRRQFADNLPKVPLPDDGMTLTLPRVQTGSTVAIQATEGGTVSETDPDWETYSVPVRTIAGQVDVTRQALERSRPSFDVVVFRDLIRAYDAALDTQLISGSGSSGQHTGLRNVSSINTVTVTGGDSSNTVKGLYNGQSQIASNAFTEGDTVLMHPRRAAAIAAFMGTSFPLLNQGGIGTVQVGTQNNAFARQIAGLNLVLDANISTNLGASTTEDEVYVYTRDELFLAEGPLRTKVFEDVLSDSLKVRLQVFAYSAAALGRIPKAIAKLSGTNFVTPTFP